MNFRHLFALALVATVASRIAVSQDRSGPLLPAVTRNLLQIQKSTETGNLDEAQAYADLTLLTRAVKYAVEGDALDVGDRAIQAWERSLAGMVRFEEVPSPSADLVLSFKPSVRSEGSGVFGLALCRRQVVRWPSGGYSYRLSGVLEVATQDDFGFTLPRAVQLQTAAHELGHFLGLQDSPVCGELMGPVDTARPVTEPGENEVLALTGLRARVFEFTASNATWPQAGRGRIALH